MATRRRNLPPLSALQPFDAAARFESFSLAANELGLTQAAISKQVRALEMDLGVMLFERRNRGVFLTNAGRCFAATVSALLLELSTETTRLRGEKTDGEVTLFCQHCEAFYWLMPRLSSFHRRYPEIELKVSSSIRPLAETELDFDVAIQTSGRAKASYPLAFTASDDIFPICHSSLLCKDQGMLSLEEMISLPLLSHNVVPQDWLDWDGWLQEVGFNRPSAAKPRTFDSYPLVLQAAIAGHGVALGWRRTVERMLEDGTLVRPVREIAMRPTELSVFTQGTRGGTGGASFGRTRPETQALLDWLESELRTERGCLAEGFVDQG